jgi:hypothetical protein
MTLKYNDQFKKVTETLVTPKGELVGFNAIATPSIKFNPDGVYNANILIAKEAGEQLEKTIKEVLTEQYKSYGKGSVKQPVTRIKPYVTVEKNDDGEVTKETPDSQDRYILKTSAKAKIKCKSGEVIDVKIPMYDAKGKPIKDIKLGEGSIVKLSLSLDGYTIAGKTGVSIKLKACQVIDLVEYQGGGNAASYGFGEEEGFEASDSEDTDTTETSDETEDDF